MRPVTQHCLGDMSAHQMLDTYQMDVEVERGEDEGGEELTMSMAEAQDFEHEADGAGKGDFVEARRPLADATCTGCGVCGAAEEGEWELRCFLTTVVLILHIVSLTMDVF